MLVFIPDKSYFLATQYINKIAKLRNRSVVYINELSSPGMFDVEDDGNLYVFKTEEYKFEFEKKNHIIISKKTDYFDAVKFPEVEQWQIVDYAKSVCSGAEESIIEKLIKSTNDLYDLDNELHKLTIFDEQIRNSLSVQFYEDNAYYNINSVEVFDFINAVQNKDLKKISYLYNAYDKDAMSFIGLMYKQVRNMVNCSLQKVPTELNTGLKQNQIYAIKKVCEKYSKNQILNLFQFLSSLDYRLKSGELPTENLFDYVLVKVLS
jgi:DNA polymerase III delta subunit